MARSGIAAALLVLVSVAPGAGMAQTFTPPEGCTGFMTVQARGCRVSNHYRCTADAPGDQWRADFDAEGVYFVSRIDAETQWVESYDMFPTVKQVLDPNPEDPASFTELLDGADSFAFGLSKDDGERSRVTGFDRLTGKTVTIDGIALLETEFDFTETSIGGTVMRRAHGNEYIHPEWRLFFAGPSQWDSTGEGDYVPVNGSPVQFIFPGEPGFAATEPLFECDALMSALPADVMPASLRLRALARGQ